MKAKIFGVLFLLGLVVTLPIFLVAIKKNTDDRALAAGNPVSYACQIGDPPAKLVYVNDIKGQLNPGQGATFVFTIANCSNETWSKGMNFKLGTQAPTDNQTWGMGRFELSQDLPVRSQLQVSIPVKAPQIPGAYTFQLGIVEEGVKWLKPYFPPAIVLVGNLKLCDGLSKIANTKVDAAPILQSCIDSASIGAVIEIPVGNYMINNQVRINKTISLVTQGLENSQDTYCLATSGLKCASFTAAQNYPANPQPGDSFLYSMFRIQNSDGTAVPRVGIKNIIFDGNRALRQGQKCISANTCVTMSFMGNKSLLYGNAFINGVSWTSMEMRGDSDVLAFNFVANNGVKIAKTLGPNDALPMTWSDGFSLINVKNLTVMNNIFSDNTDVDLIMWGANNAQVAFNQIQHTDINHESFMAIALESQTPDYPSFADFKLADISYNKIDCNKLCGIGIAIGTKPYRRNYIPVYGATVRNNVIQGTMQGIIVEEGGTKTDPINLDSNTITQSGGYTSGCGFSTGILNIAPTSVVNLAGGQKADSNYSWNQKTQSAPSNSVPKCALPSCIFGTQYCKK